MIVPFNYLNYQFKDKKNILLSGVNLLILLNLHWVHSLKNLKKFSKYVGVKHCISTNNGTDALILSLKSLGIKSGDEVITVCNSFYATAGAIEACGAKIVFVDSDERYQIDVNKIENVITKKLRQSFLFTGGSIS